MADGVGNTADFSTVNLPGDTSINVVDPRTIGDLIFGDTEIVNSPASWSLSGNTITLAATTPTITVGALGSGKSVTIGDVIAGTAGFTKAGPGTLVLTANNTFTGGLNITGGTADNVGFAGFSSSQASRYTFWWRRLEICRTQVTGTVSGWGMRSSTSDTSQPPPFDGTLGSVYVPAGQIGTLSPAAGTAVGQVGGERRLDIECRCRQQFHFLCNGLLGDERTGGS